MKTIQGKKQGKTDNQIAIELCKAWLNPALEEKPKNIIVAVNEQQSVFLNDGESLRSFAAERGLRLVVVMKDGERLIDDEGNAIEKKKK